MAATIDKKPANISARPLDHGDIGLIVDYFHKASDDFLLKMAVDRNKLPERNQWIKLIQRELHLPYEKRSMYYVIWLMDQKTIGHSNVNRITFGKEAYMHLHIWNPNYRKAGIGQQLLRLSIPYFIKHFHLERLLCEPNAYNEPPNKTLPKLGFRLLGTYETIPGPINLHQMVNRWELRKEDITEKL